MTATTRATTKPDAPKLTLAERLNLFAIPEPNSGCWLWLGALDGSGYGSVRDEAGRPAQVHRIAYRLFRQPIPEACQLDHLCRVRSCVNPWHLDPVSSRENTLRGDGPSARHARQTHCVSGHPFDTNNTLTIGRRRACRACNRLRASVRRSALKGADGASPPA